MGAHLPNKNQLQLCMLIFHLYFSRGIPPITAAVWAMDFIQVGYQENRVDK